MLAEYKRSKLTFFQFEILWDTIDVIMDIEIRRALPEEAEALTQIAIAAKGHWGYPERWMQIWTPELTFRSEYFEKNESWMASVDNRAHRFLYIAGERW